MSKGFNFKNKLFIAGYGLWGCLGFYRGGQKYNKRYNSDYKYYQENIKYTRKPKYYYLTYFGESIFHTTIYMFPPTLPIYFVDELYNLEDKIRNLSSEEQDN
jgi:hypothetical protein